MCRQELHEVQQGQVQSPEPGQEKAHAAGAAVAQLSGKQYNNTLVWWQTQSEAECGPAMCPCHTEHQQPPGCTGTALPAGLAK